MNKTHIFEIETEKSFNTLISEIKKKALKSGFQIKEEFSYAELFEEHGVKIDNKEDFKFYSIQICLPERAYNSIKVNPKRITLINPKNIVISEDKTKNKRIISYFYLGEDVLKKILPEDEKVHKSIPESSNKIIELIKSAI